MPQHDNNDNRSGLTLLEVVLAISISAVIIGFLAALIRVELRAFDANRREVTESQLARALLRQISSELRGVVNVSVIVADANSAVAGAVTTAVDVESAEATGGETDSDAADATGEYLDQALPTEPGLYGSQFDLLFDTQIAVSLPATPIANVAPPVQTSADTLQAVPRGELRRVAYYVGFANNENISPAMDVNAAWSGSTAASGGLMRSVMDHPVAHWAAENGGAFAADAGQLLAPEVVAIEFQYFDGAQWLTEWDSVVQGGLPVAVEIILEFARGENASMPQQGLTTGTLSADSRGIYRRTVFLPTATPTDEVEEAM